METFARLEVQGVMTEKRMLESKTNKDWRGYVAKFAVLGQMVEVELEVEDFNSLKQGLFYRITCRPEERTWDGRTFTKYIVQSLQEAKVKAA